MIILPFIILSLLTFDALGMKRSYDSMHQEPNLQPINPPNIENQAQQGKELLPFDLLLPELKQEILIFHLPEILKAEENLHVFKQIAQLTLINKECCSIFTPRNIAHFFCTLFGNNALVQLTAAQHKKSLVPASYADPAYQQFIANQQLVEQGKITNFAHFQVDTSRLSQHDFEAIQELLKITPNLAISLWNKDSSGKTPLCYAIHNQDKQLIECYKIEGAHKNSPILFTPLKTGNNSTAGNLVTTLKQFIGTETTGDFKTMLLNTFEIKKDSIQHRPRRQIAHRPTTGVARILRAYTKIPASLKLCKAAAN